MADDLAHLVGERVRGIATEWRARQRAFSETGNAAHEIAPCTRPA
jgi:hypothetical protein